MSRTEDKHKHHYVPVTYLKNFCDITGKIYAYRKDNPITPIYVQPRNVGYQNDYYSQPTPDGGWDHNAVENTFDQLIERQWTPIVQIIKNEELLNHNLETLFQFVSVMRVRVPACRDMVELSLADHVKGMLHILDEKGELPPKPKDFENILDNIQVSVDPHKSIHAMAEIIQGIEKLFAIIGFEVLCNRTNINLLTSDNPVIYFNPDCPEQSILPYVVSTEKGQAELLFPIDSKHILRGHTKLLPNFLKNGIEYRSIKNKKIISRINRFVSRFAYQVVFSADRQKDNECLISHYASTSPVLKTETISLPTGTMFLQTMEFGARRRKAKWKGASS